jgi:hypothetical protein
MHLRKKSTRIEIATFECQQFTVHPNRLQTTAQPRDSRFQIAISLLHDRERSDIWVQVLDYFTELLQCVHSNVTR